MTAVTLNLSSLLDKVSDRQLELLARDNPEDRQVEIYRHSKDTEILDNPQSLSGEDVMPNLIVDLSEILG